MTHLMIQNYQRPDDESEKRFTIRIVDLGNK